MDAPYLSAATYFSIVTVLSLAIIALALFRDPADFHLIMQLAHLERHPHTAADGFYALRVAPILQEHCASCHRSVRHKGKLRLDSLAALLRGGRHGTIIDIDHPDKSDVIRRVNLPRGNDEAMPPEDKQPLSADDVTVLRLWIAAGASGTQAESAIAGAPKPASRVELPDVDETAVARLREPLAEQVADAQRRVPGLLIYASRGSSDLELHAGSLGRSFDDASLKQVTRLASRLVWVDLSRTGITDASASTIMLMVNLREMRLTDTRVTDALIDSLLSLHSLRSVTLLGTATTDVANNRLRSQGIKVYAFDQSPANASHE